MAPPSASTEGGVLFFDLCAVSRRRTDLFCTRSRPVCFCEREAVAVRLTVSTHAADCVQIEQGR